MDWTETLRDEIEENGIEILSEEEYELFNELTCPDEEEGEIGEPMVDPCGIDWNAPEAPSNVV